MYAMITAFVDCKAAYFKFVHSALRIMVGICFQDPLVECCTMLLSEMGYVLLISVT